MKNLMRTVLTVAFCLSPVLLTTGCTNTGTADAFAGLSEEPITVGVVIAARSDFPQFDKEILLPYLQQLVYGGGTLILTVSDGRPGSNLQTYEVNGIAEECRGKETEYVKKYFTKNLKPLAIAVNEVKAQAENAAVLEAIRETARNMQDAAGEKVLLIFDNGIQTDGVIQMVSANFDTEKLLDSLAASDNIPDLSNTKVEWYGMGSLSDIYDSALSERELNHLRTFWEGFCKRGGAAAVSIYGKNIRTAEAVPDGLPAVRMITITDRPVPFPEITEYTTRTETETTETTVTETTIDTVLKLGEQAAKFKPDSETELVDETATKANLAPIAEQLRQSGQRILLIGTIATVRDSKDCGVSFSCHRAERIKQIFTEFGVPSELIYTAGAGYLEKGILTQEDVRSDGSLDTQRAVQNRAVWLFTIDNVDEEWFDLIQKYLPQ